MCDKAKLNINIMKYRTDKVPYAATFNDALHVTSYVNALNCIKNEKLKRLKTHFEICILFSMYAPSRNTAQLKQFCGYFLTLIVPP